MRVACLVSRLCLSLSILVSCRLAGAAGYRITIAAGANDYANPVVTFALPEAARHFNALRAADGTLLPLQVDAQGHAACIIGALPHGATKMFDLVETGYLGGTGVQVQQVGDVVQVGVDGHPVLEYQGGPGTLPRPDIKPIYRRGGIIHPVFSPSGKLVTDSYAPNHLHQHGIWFSWTKTEFEGRHPDFWNMGDGTGTVEFVALEGTWNGPVEGGFRSRQRYVDLSSPQHKVALNETWELTMYDVGATAARPYRMFDLTVTQECATTSPLRLPKYHYGGLGLRGNWNWNGASKTNFLTSDGETDRVKGNETRGRWCHMGGLVDGTLTGIAVLCHPDNFRAPQPMRLHPTEPFFCYAPSQLGDWAIKPGQPYISRYRFIVQDGAPDQAELDRLWNEYAHPPVVQVQTP